MSGASGPAAAGSGASLAPAAAAVLWHDLECGSYAADLGVWEELADRCAGEVLDLGCGTGRVALHLARRGSPVLGVDSDPDLVAELNRRAEERGAPARAVVGDVRSLDGVEGGFGLAIAPMQLAHLLDRAGRAEMLAALRRRLAPRGRAALALLPEDLGEQPEEGPPPVPDATERQGWVFSSLPLPAIASGRTISVERLRQTVSPAGELSERRHSTLLHTVSPRGLEAEAEAAGLRACGRGEVPPTDDHVGSIVVILER
ncbi:MAG: class I SAM-dependent methyltransferase [Solirubrobacterales bacterium]